MFLTFFMRRMLILDTHNSKQSKKKTIKIVMAILLRLAFANSESSKRVIKLLQFSLVGKTTRYYIKTSDRPPWVFENWVSGFGSGLESMG